MQPINQIKLSLTLGILVIVIPLSGFPQSFKTSLLVAFGALLVYMNVTILHNERMKRPKKTSQNRKTHTFIENKPQQQMPVDSSISEHDTSE